ncbi:NADPH dehydrogenase [Alteripontixanthobacter maritimus]|uniref:NADPH dehydrogenase n=1 Tax=Alteripontixanthobacter maritimus TaxID=2161824 RepID=A0A369Q7J9_9SPHN|nr:NADH:flavin oxidoreductase/NADH oxidase family protein [Alteripontixanthobacter maritimus]RDC60360.1 NADPH dehydrogenase [Alteripontixanthobacter maritimus]
MDDNPSLARPLPLPCGLVLPNRLAKAAMTEGLADAAGLPTTKLETLYRRWSDGGTGLLITGNIQIDADHLERAGNVVIDGVPDASRAAALASFAKAAKSGGSAVIAQLSHGGRQTPAPINPAPKAPSAVPLGAMPFIAFGQPQAMTADDIAIIERKFVDAAKVCHAAGFDGVQVHAAHGYLLSSFLSPLLNRRDDEWGGSLENRAKLLLDIVRKVRAECPAPFAISVKLNSADFQRGGFAIEDSERVAGWLDEAGMDLLEISGGTYEQTAMMGNKGDDDDGSRAGAQARTAAREAYFQEFAPRIRAALDRAKLMVTGGFRSRDGMEHALAEDGIDLIGIARPLIVDPDISKHLLGGYEETQRIENELRVGPGPLSPQSRFAAIKALNASATQAWYYEQLERLGAGEEVDPKGRILTAAMAFKKRDAAKLAAIKAAR